MHIYMYNTTCTITCVHQVDVHVQPVRVPLQSTHSPSLTQIVQEVIDVILQGLKAQEEVKVHGTWVT